MLRAFMADHPSRGRDDDVERAAQHTFRNWLGCAVGAARHPTIEAALAAVRELAPSAQASVLGRSQRVDMASVALLNGITSHMFDAEAADIPSLTAAAQP
jgi:2-methylcitrate dehydratase PrpD